MTRTLTEANENSIWGKLYQNKMDGLDSFYPFKNGLEHILNKSKVAYLQNGEQIRYFEDYHCKVRTINIHRIYLYILKVASDKIIPLPCKYSILLCATFVEIKNSFTKTLLVFNSKNFRIIFYWKKTDESEPI